MAGNKTGHSYAPRLIASHFLVYMFRHGSRYRTAWSKVLHKSSSIDEETAAHSKSCEIVQSRAKPRRETPTDVHRSALYGSVRSHLENPSGSCCLIEIALPFCDGTKRVEQVDFWEKKAIKVLTSLGMYAISANLSKEFASCVSLRSVYPVRFWVGAGRFCSVKHWSYPEIF